MRARSLLALKSTGERQASDGKQSLPERKKYVDDGIILCKINMQTGRLTEEARGGKEEKEKHDLITQNMFRRVVSKATSRDMVVNAGKTRLLCVSDALNTKPVGFFLDSDGRRLESTDSMKILGYHLDNGPTVHANVEALRARMREPTWVLRHLKLSGFNECELARVYTTICLLYTSPSPRDRQKSRMPSSA